MKFSGYASVFGIPDQGGDIVMKGAFARSLRRRADRVRMLFQHDPKEPVGLWETVREDRHGLFVEGTLVAGVERAEGLAALIAEGAVDGLSIGFRTVRADREPGTGHRRLHEIELWEISIVTFPMMDAARIAPALTDPGEARLARSLSAALTLIAN